MRPVLFLSATGCLLPSLIMLNFFFGWLFLPLGRWLLLELILVALFVLNTLIISRRVIGSKLTSSSSAEAVDVEGEVVEDVKGAKDN